MTDLNWNFKDYELDFPDVPPYEGPLIGMPLPHKVAKLAKFFAHEIVHEIRRCLDNHAELAALLVCLASVDYLAGFVHGHETRGTDYEALLQSSFFPAEYSPLAHDIYVQLRNGLMHNLVTLNPWRTEGKRFHVVRIAPNHLNATEDGSLIFSVHTFTIDILRAYAMYQHALLNTDSPNRQLIQRFNKRFDMLDGQGAFMERTEE